MSRLREPLEEIAEVGELLIGVANRRLVMLRFQTCMRAEQKVFTRKWGTTYVIPEGLLQTCLVIKYLPDT